LVIAPKKRSIYNPVILLDQMLVTSPTGAHPAEPATIQEPTVSYRRGYLN